jgi:hypothetical protein
MKSLRRGILLTLVFGVITSAARSAEASECLITSLSYMVESSDLIIVATVVHEDSDFVRVDRTLKGRTTDPNYLLDPSALAFCWSVQVPKVGGAQMLILSLKDAGPRFIVQLPIRNGRLEVQPYIAEQPLTDYQTTIRTLVRLQAQARVGGPEARRALEEAAASSDPHVRIWAFSSGPSHMSKPTPTLARALIRAWTGDDVPVDRGAILNAIGRWRIREAVPLLLAGLRTGNMNERCNLALTLGTMKDLSVAESLRNVAASDPSPVVRGAAYHGLASLLGPDSLSDLARGKADHRETVRAAVASAATGLIELESDPFLRAVVLSLLDDLSGDSSLRVRRAATDYLRWLEEHR